VLVTRNCFPTADTPSDSDCGNFLLQGVLALARTAGIENPGLTIRCIDLEHRVGEAYAPETQASFRNFIAADSKEEQGHLNRKGEFFSRRLIRTTLPDQSDDGLSASSDRSTYIIAGGLGGIGRCAADWLAKAQDASHIILLGRSTLDESSDRWIKSLNSKTSVVEYRQVDITDLTALRRCLEDQPKDKIAGIFQCAGVLNDQPLASADWSAFCEVIEPKLCGTLNLLALFGGESPVPFTTFGSIASIFSPKWQASHSAANGFLDGVAAAAQRLNHPFKHAQWGPWSEVGAAASGDVQQGLERIGVKPFDPSAGISMVSEIARRRPRSLALMDVDWQQFLSRWPTRSLLSEIQEAMISAKADVPDKSAGKPLGSRPVDNELLQKLRSQSRRQAETAIMTVLAELIAPVLGFRREDEVDRDLGFFDLGLDSLTSVELRDAIEKRLSIKLDATALFKFSSVRALSVALYDSILGGDQPSEGPDTGSGSFGSPNTDNTHRSEEALNIAADSEIAQMSEAELEQLFDRHLSDE
jgi:acyl carrier protein